MSLYPVEQTLADGSKVPGYDPATGKYTNGDPSAGLNASSLPAEWINLITDLLQYRIDKVIGSSNPDDIDQLYKAGGYVPVNCYLDGASWKYLADGKASLIQFSGGKILLNIAITGVKDAVITWKEYSFDESGKIAHSDGNIDIQGSLSVEGKSVKEHVFAVGDVVTSFASSREGFLLWSGKTIGKSGSAAALADDKYEALFNFLKEFPDRGNTGTEDWAAGDTVYLPDQAFQFIRGAINGTIAHDKWDTITNITVDLGRSDIPNGTPIIFETVPTGLAGIAVGVVYYLGINTGTQYYLYDTEANANANDGTTGKIALSGTVTGNCNYSSVGANQGFAHQLLTGEIDQHYLGTTSLGAGQYDGAFSGSGGAGGYNGTAGASGNNRLIKFNSSKSDQAQATINDVRGPNTQLNYFIKY